MPDVPNVPGVPRLSSYSVSDLRTMFSDNFTGALVLFAPSWGIYADNGQPIIIPASIVTQEFSAALASIGNVAALIGVPNIVPVAASTAEFEYAGESPISNYPQENGAFQSYNKVQMPFDVKVKLTVSGSDGQRQAFFNTLDAIRKSTTIVSVVTPERVYSSCNCKHVDYRRTARSGVEMITADVWFEEVRVIAATTFSNTQTPGSAAQQSIGNVQPQSATNIEQQFATSGIRGSF